MCYNRYYIITVYMYILYKNMIIMTQLTTGVAGAFCGGELCDIQNNNNKFLFNNRYVSLALALPTKRSCDAEFDVATARLCCGGINNSER